MPWCVDVSNVLNEQNETTSHRTGAAGMVAAVHSESHQGPPGNGGHIFERSWGRRTAAKPMGTWVDKPSQGDSRRNRQRLPKPLLDYLQQTGQRGDYRLWRGIGPAARLRS